MQDIVYKLVPGLQEGKSHPLLSETVFSFIHVVYLYLAGFTSLKYARTLTAHPSFMDCFLDPSSF